MTLRATLTALSLVTAFGCSDRVLDDAPARDARAPRITITGPERGTIVPDSSVTVSGIVQDADSEVVSVHVNGVFANLQPGGEFRAIVPVVDGVTLLKTVAVDSDGNEGTDTRGVFAGELVPARQEAEDAIVAHLTKTTFNNISSAIQEYLVSNTLGEELSGANPVLAKGSDCNQVSLNIEDVSIRDANISLRPVEAGVAFDVDLRDVFVELDAGFKLACLGGSSGVLITADQFQSSGHITIDLVDDELEVNLDTLDSSFVNLEVDFGFLDTEIIEMIVQDMDSVASSAINALIRYQFENFTNGLLASFTAGEWTTEVLGAQLKFGIRPVVVDFSTEGGLIIAHGNVQAVEGRTVGYLSTPTPAPMFGSITERGLQLAIADDFLNQAFTAFWASGAMEGAVFFDKDAEGNENKGGSGLLGLPIDRVQVTMMLPPITTATNPAGVTLTVADIMVDVQRKNSDGETYSAVTRVAVSGEVDVSITGDPSGEGLRFSTGRPRLFVDLLDEGVEGSNPFNHEELETLVGFVAGRVVQSVDDLMGQIPLPSFVGIEIVEPEFEAQGGYVAITADLE